MMRKLEPGYYECTEHGGTFDKRGAFDHLMAEHPELSMIAERILDANRDSLPIHPAIRRQGGTPNRAERRAAARRARRNARH